MNRKSSVDGREKPSIIEEIVIYDKPNKPLVPQDIYPEPSIYALGQGDIVLSRSKDVTSLGPSISRTAKVRKVKNEPSEDEEILEYESEGDEFYEPSRVNIKTEEGAEEEFDNSENYSTEDDDSSEPEESIENISKEISKSTTKSPVVVAEREPAEREPKRATRQATKVSEDDIDYVPHNAFKKCQKSKEVPAQVISKEPKDSPFKRPRGRPRKSTTAPPKSASILNFVIRQPKNITQLNVSTEEEEETNEDRGNGKNTNEDETVTGEGRQKRLRRRPKKYGEYEITDEEMLFEHFSDEDVPLTSPWRKRQYAELSIVPVGRKDSSSGPGAGNTDDLDELLQDVQQQINEVEVELQNFAGDSHVSQAVESPKKPRGKGAKKYPASKAKRNQQKMTAIPEKNIKKEIDELNDDITDIPHEEVHESDEDSRKEWVPEEYAEYKRQCVVSRNKMHKCKFCSSWFPTYYSLRKHRALEHNDVGKDRKESTFEPPEVASEEPDDLDESDEESRGEWLPEDYAEYKMKHNLNKMKRSQWYTCKICCAVFSNYYKLSKHKAEHENKANPYQCKLCGEQFGDVDSVTAHIRIHRGEDPYKCKKCDQGFHTKEELDAHMPIHVLKKGPPPVKRYRCDLCNKEFSKLCDIERHTRVHTGEKPCECNICHKRFQQAHNLSKHLLTHLHVKPFQCEICNKKFGRIDVLNRHLLTHSIEKPFKCDVCKRGFIRQVQLSNHVEKIHPEVDLASAGFGSVTDEVIVTSVL